MNDLATLTDTLVGRLRAEFGDDLLGVLVTGSRIHGTPGLTSDLDAHVLIAPPRRQRRNFVLDGVEIELFINPPFQVRRYMAAPGANDPHMFTFGRAAYDPHGVVAQLRDEARVIWEAGPPRVALVWLERYHAADLLRDLQDVAKADEASANMLIARLVDDLLGTHSRIRGQWLDKPKRRLASLERWDSQAAQLARAALTGPTLDERHTAIEQLATHVLAPLGGPMPLEWHTEWETLSDNAE